MEKETTKQPLLQITLGFCGRFLNTRHQSDSVMTSRSGEHLWLPLENGVPAVMSQLWKLHVELHPGLRNGGQGVLEFTALLSQGRWPSGVASLLPQMHLALEGTGFPFLRGTSVSEGVAVKLLPWK